MANVKGIHETWIKNNNFRNKEHGEEEMNVRGYNLQLVNSRRRTKHTQHEYTQRKSANMKGRERNLVKQQWAVFIQYIKSRINVDSVTGKVWLVQRRFVGDILLLTLPTPRKLSDIWFNYYTRNIIHLIFQNQKNMCLKKWKSRCLF